MMTSAEVYSLADALPSVRGTYEANVSLSSLTWFRVGGPADILFRPADTDDLVDFLREKPEDIPVSIIGVGSNLLVRDKGVRGVVIRLSRAFSFTRIEGDTIVAGASTPDVSVSLTAQQSGLAGLEFLRGVPGTVGGAVRMNAGAYDREISDVLETATTVSDAGEVHVLTSEDLGFSYRHCNLGKGWIVTSVVLRGTPDDPDAIKTRMTNVSDSRQQSQPVKERTGGSTFKNPKGKSAWELIDKAGCRGLTVGGARVSDHHCNFMINTGTASAEDLETLGQQVKQRVLKKTGVELDWEIQIVGEKSPDGGAQ